MPLPIWLAHKLARRLTSARLQKILPYLPQDGKTQVGIEFRDRVPHRIHSITVIASQQKGSGPNIRKLSDDIREAVIDNIFRDEDIKPDKDTRIFVNPDGLFITGGPQFIQDSPAEKMLLIPTANILATAEQLSAARTR